MYRCGSPRERSGASCEGVFALKSFELFAARCRGNPKNTLYGETVTVSSVEDLARAASLDHVAAKYIDNRRSKSGFVRSNVVALDLDNDLSDNPVDWKDLADIAAAFPRVGFYAVESRHHLQQKGEKAPRPKYHVYFPLSSSTSSAEAYEELKRQALSVFPGFDSNAVDAARFLFGVEHPQVHVVEGSLSLDAFLLCFAPPPAAAKATPEVPQAAGETAAIPAVPMPSERRPVLELGQDVEEGHRNAELHRFAFRKWMQGLSAEEVLLLSQAANDHFSSPLPADEVETIVRSACSKPLDRDANIYRAEVAMEFAQALDASVKSTSDVLSMADIQERKAAWLIDGFIPRNELTILGGAGGIGKTFIWTALAAAVSSGRKPFLLNDSFSDNNETLPQKVMFFSSEDDLGAVLRGRLRASGANLENIITVDSSSPDFQRVKLNSAFLEQLIERYRPALVIFDPLQSFLPPRTDMRARNDMREAVSKLHVFGAKYGTTFLVVAHTNKAAGVWGRNRLADSSDLWDAARAVLICGMAEQKSGLRYLSPEKSSYGPLARTVLFRVEDNTVSFVGYSDLRDEDYVRAASKQSAVAPERESAERFILEYLDAHGESKVKDLDTAAAGSFISPHTLRRAKETLRATKKIRTWCVGDSSGKGAIWHVSLTDAAGGQIG